MQLSALFDKLGLCETESSRFFGEIGHDSPRKYEYRSFRYIVWDKKERTSLIVAFTLAGSEDAIVVSTDSLGIGAWTKPGRGEIPYAWQVTKNWLWMGPPMLPYDYYMSPERHAA